MQRFEHRFSTSSFQSIELLLSGLKQILEMTSQSLQLAEMGWRRRPGSGLLLFTETTDQSCIRTIIFVAQQFALAESFDLGGIDNADDVTLLMEIRAKASL